MPFIPHTSEDTAAMLKEIGVKTIDDLFAEIPHNMRPKSFNLPDGLSELEATAKLSAMAARNTLPKMSFLGGGVYNHNIPAAVDALSMRGEFYTAYTPYQPEAAQGTLQTIFEYQTAVCRLLGMDVANASIYDGGSALFESCMMAVRLTKRESLVIDAGVNPFYREMLATLTANLGITLKVIPLSTGGVTSIAAMEAAIDDSTAAIVLQNPTFLGEIADHTTLVAKAHANKALAVMVANPVLAAVIKTPGEMGVDIAVAEGQGVGLPMSSGGSYLGIMACKKELIRQMPGRIVGRTNDVDGKVGYVLTLQAREQHIRRAKATSNICSNQALCALRTLIHLSLLGPEGLERTALLSMQRAREAAAVLTALPGVSLINKAPYGYEFAITLPKPAATVAAQLAKKGIMAGIPLGKLYKGHDNTLLIACTEQTTPAEIDTLAKEMRGVL